MGTNAAASVSQRCDPDLIAAQTIDAYELAKTHWRHGGR
jgi:hypothetical protein